MPNNHLPRAGAKVRAVRESFARGTAVWRKQIADVLADPDLLPEARARKAETLRAAIKAEATVALTEAREAVTNAARVRAMFDPAVLRRKAVMQDPARAAALRDVFAALPVDEIDAFAEDAVAGRDEVATFALLAAIGGHPNVAGNERLAATAKRLHAPLDAGSTSAIADHVVASRELAVLEHADVAAARGEKVDLGALMERIDQISYSVDEHATEYRLVGLSPVAPDAVSSLPPIAEPKQPGAANAFAGAF